MVFDCVEPVPLTAVREAREICTSFRIPPRQFRRRTARGAVGCYSPKSDIVAVDPDKADADGLGGDDGYYAALVHELLHATGHPRRLERTTTGDYSAAGYALEEGTVATAMRIVLADIGFGAEAIEWHAPARDAHPFDRRAAIGAADWLLR